MPNQTWWITKYLDSGLNSDLFQKKKSKSDMFWLLQITLFWKWWPLLDSCNSAISGWILTIFSCEGAAQHLHLCLSLSVCAKSEFLPFGPCLVTAVQNRTLCCTKLFTLLYTTLHSVVHNCTLCFTQLYILNWFTFLYTVHNCTIITVVHSSTLWTVVQLYTLNCKIGMIGFYISN